MSVRSKNARHFAEGCAPIAYVPQTKRNRETIKRAIRKRKRERVCGNDSSNSLCFRYCEHFLRKICGDNFGMWQCLRQSEGQISGSGRKIYNRIWVPIRDNSRGPLAPAKIAAATQDVVCEIVAARDAAKHFPDCFGITRTRKLIRINQAQAFRFRSFFQVITPDRSQASPRASLEARVGEVKT